jgi:hypothetical protein
MSRFFVRAALLAFALAAAPAPAATRCDEKCLLALADRTMAAVTAKNVRSLPWAEHVRFTENGVPINIPDGLWGSTGSGPARKVLAVADERTGNVVWIGTVFDHEQPAFGSMRLQATEDGDISEIEFVIARKTNPGPYGDAAAFAADPALIHPIAASNRTTRERLVDVADAYLSTRQHNDGTLFVQFTPDCALRVNGVSQTSGADAIAQGCEAQYKLGAYKPIERVRERRFPVVDEARGLVVAISQQDMPVRDTRFTTTDGAVRDIKDKFPSTRTVVEILRIDGGRVARSEAISVYQPYRMPNAWKD